MTDNRKSQKKFIDPRFLGLVYGLRKNNRADYALSQAASEELSRNDKMSAQYTQDMWDEFWRELVSEYRHNLGLDGSLGSV